MKHNITGFIFLFTILLLSLFVTKPTHAQALFSDQFNGNGELHSYNGNYQHVDNFPNGFGSGGQMNLSSDHVEATGYDPAYVYTAIPGDNVCASIDFNWSNGGNWTGIMFRTSPEATPDKNWSMFSVHGGDHRWFLYRFGPSGHSQLDGPITVDYSETHTIKVCLEGASVEGFLDGNLLTSATYNSLGGYLGFSSQIGTKYLDNFRLESIQSDVDLNVPLLKQTSSPWNIQVYNSANLWNPTDPSIGAWGCAMTSAAMVFKYHGINKLPDGKTLDPGTLNSWLKKQKDGYVGNGLLNWIALTRLSKQAKNINGLSFNALEYTRTDGYVPNKLTEAISNNLPGVLKEPGHFVVGKGTIGGTFSINDPYYSRTSLNDYGNTFQNLGVYTPSNTDLSYIMLTVGSNTSVQLLDSGGNSVGETFLEEPITNPQSPDQNNGNMKVLYLQKPVEDDYQIVLSSAGEPDYELNIYLYDKNGDVFTRSETGTFLPEQNIIIPLHFNGQEDLYTRRVTFLSTTLDIEKAYKQRQITKISVKRNLEEKLARAFVQKLLKNEERELRYLLEFEDVLNQNKGIKILEPAFTTLLYDVNYLSTHL